MRPNPPEPSPAGRPARPEDFSLLTEEDVYLFNEGSHLSLHEKLGAHPVTVAEAPGVFFAVFAPNALQVSVVGDFNGWTPDSHSLRPRGSSGIWERFFPGIPEGSAYKYRVVSRYRGFWMDKTDPFGSYHEVAPRTASRVHATRYDWKDAEWMAARASANPNVSAMSVYEMHLGSWRRPADDPRRFLTYRELAEQLPEYVAAMGFTHVELLPLMEHPFYGSWGYQVTGFFAPTSRYGPPEDLMGLIDALHARGIGVILDWVPSHFPSDAHGLGYFDGTHLFEHADPRQGYHPDWQSLIFNYDRTEVRSFLLSSALFWIEKFHADGLRVDAVASMLYLDYSRKAGEWIPNAYGGRENLGAISFLRRLNDEIRARHPGVITVAEESTSWPMVSRPTHVGGLGFHMKWDMGWMNDTLEYMELDPIHRRFHHDKLTFRRVYAYSENFVLPLSHDEVVHLKRALVTKMPGDDWQRFANLRLLYGYMCAQPGKKLLFMGGEIGQWGEWNHDASLDWEALAHPWHSGVQRWVRDLNRLYAAEGALHERDFDPSGFEWIDCHDYDHSVVSLLRRGDDPAVSIVAVLNFTPVPRPGYRIGVPHGGLWKEIANSDAVEYGGSGEGNLGGVEAEERPAHGRPFSLPLMIPPLAAVFLRGEAPTPEARRQPEDSGEAPA
ncbi:MAG: 1,4-alpha-glucan branching protein GlgB [Thermoanaerobaculia bacterium]